MSGELWNVDSELSKSVMNWIPPSLRRGIRANTTVSPDDVSTYIETAMNQCGSYELTFPPGTYAISRQLVIANAVRLRARGATLLVTADIDTVGDGRGSALYFNQIAPNIDGLAINLNSKNGNGIFVASCNAPRFERMGISGSKAGYAGIRGGAVLYGEIDRCSISGSGRSLDFQKGWEYRTPMLGSPTLTFVSAGVGLGGTITRSAGSWITDGYSATDRIKIELAVNAANNSEFVITSRTATVITLTTGTLTNEGPTSGCVASIVAGSYYGFHDASISKTLLYGLEGCRLAGYTMITQTDHEHAVNQPAFRNEDPAVVVATPMCAAICVGEELSRSNHSFHDYELRSVYMELAVGTGVERAVGTLTSGNVFKFDGGQYFGAVGPAAGSTCFYNVLSAGTGVGIAPDVRRWESAFEGQFSGGGGHNGLMDLTRAFVTSDVTNVFKPGTGVQPYETLRTWGHWSDRSYMRNTGLIQGMNTAYVVHTITPNTTTNQIDLALGRQWYLTAAGAITLGSTYFVTANIKPGQEFLFTFHDANITIDNAFIHLRGAANRTFAIGESLRGYVDQAGVLREQGY